MSIEHLAAPTANNDTHDTGMTFDMEANATRLVEDRILTIDDVAAYLCVHARPHDGELDEREHSCGAAPLRLQLSRRKGWRKPEGAVVVARPSRWGNPYRVSDRVTPAEAVTAYALAVSTRYRIFRAAVHMMGMTNAWNEEQHDRSGDGRFTEMPCSAPESCLRPALHLIAYLPADAPENASCGLVFRSGTLVQGGRAPAAGRFKTTDPAFRDALNYQHRMLFGTPLDTAQRGQETCRRGRRRRDRSARVTSWGSQAGTLCAASTWWLLCDGRTRARPRSSGSPPMAPPIG